MEAGRRNLLRLTVPALALLFSGAGRLAGQASPQSPFPQTREPEPPPKLDPRPLLKMNQKDIKRDVQRLFELAEELKKEVDHANHALHAKYRWEPDMRTGTDQGKWVRKDGLPDDDYD